MHHLYPSLKGDPLCPLGFHPQTRYPTRCKRCFRDYKEHGGRRGIEDVAVSSPNLSDGLNSRPASRSWTSTQNLSNPNGSGSSNDIELKKRPQSWASTPDVDDANAKAKDGSNSGSLVKPIENQVNVTVKLPTTQRRHTTTLDLKEVESSLLQNPSGASSSLKFSTSPSRSIPDDLVIVSSDSLAERARKMNLLKKQRSLNSRESSRERENTLAENADVEKSKPPLPYRPDQSKTGTDTKRLHLPPKKTISSSTSTTRSVNSTKISVPINIENPTKASASSTSVTSSSKVSRKETDKQKASEDLVFMLKLKDTKYSDMKKRNDNLSITTETTENTLVGPNERELLEDIKNLRNELDSMKARAERAERDKSDILLRRLASMDTAPNRTAASEALMLQQKVNELKDQLEKVNEEKRKLNTRMKEIENRPKNGDYDLKRKLQAAEQLCEELMDENQEAKKDIMNLQAEMDELQDTFRDDEVRAKTSLQKDLEKTTKNCRILSFKLKKCERKIEILEQEKQSSCNAELTAKMKKLEEELRFSNELARKLQVEADELRNPGKRKPPMLGVLGKSTSADAKITRDSLTRGGSQEDPQQLLRDLQDSVERESDLKDQLKFAEEEAENLRKKVARFEDENESLMMQLKKMATRSRIRSRLNEAQSDRDEGISDEDDPAELRILLELNEQEASILRLKVDDLEKENNETKRQIKELQGKLQQDTSNERLKALSAASFKVNDLEQKLKKSDEECKKLNSKVKNLEDKIKIQNNQIKQVETLKSLSEIQLKNDKDKFAKLEKDYDKERKDREKIEAKLTHIENELLNTQKAAEKTKSILEKEVKELKLKSSKSESKHVVELKKQLDDLQKALVEEKKQYKDLNTHWEKLSEETILMRAELTTEKQNIQMELNSAKQKLAEMEQIRVERTDFAKKLNDAQKRIREFESKDIKSGSTEYEKTMLRNKLLEKEQEFDKLRRENEMNIDLVFQLRKDNDDLNSKLNDFSRIEQAQSSINGHSASLETEIKSLKRKLENSELQLKSEVASTRLRYEQQVKNLSGELTSMQRQCEKFKKDRDTFKQLLELAQKKIGDLKANNTGRQSRGSMHSSDDDDKSKIAYFEQQIGSLEDQLVEARLEVSRVKTELVSERSANEIKISEMQSKLNEFEEERVIGSGRTKIPGMKTKLELSWQKEREDQQRLLQETSTLARDLRQTLFEVERERDKERLESKRRLDQLKRANEEEMEEGRKKIAELQCDLLELRDVHAKLRTSNEKLRRERERYEKELIKRRMEQNGGEKKIGMLLQTVDELVKIAPDLKVVTSLTRTKMANPSNSLQPEKSNKQRSRSPSPTLSNSHISSVLARLAEASEELRKFQRFNEDEIEKNRIRRSNLRRAASQENDPHGSTGSISSATGSSRNDYKFSRSGHNGSLMRKSLSLDHSIQKDQNIWRQDDGSMSSIQSVDSELGGLVRDSSYDSRLDSRLSGGSTQSDIPRGPRKKKKSLMGKLRSLTKSSRNSESEVSIQGSDSDLSVASDMRSSKKDLRGRLSGMFKRSGSTSRSNSTERVSVEQRPVAVTVVGEPDGPQPKEPPPSNAVTPKPIRSIAKPPTPSPTTPLTKRRLAK